MRTWAKTILAAGLLFIFVAGPGPGAYGQDTLVRARIGLQVKAGQNTFKAKAKETIKAGDLLRIFVQPEFNACVYVVHSDQTKATLLNMVRQQREAVAMVMPSLQEYYQVDGKSKVESFTIVCSPAEIAEMAELVQKGSLDHKAWSAIEEKLARQGKIELSQAVEKPFALAGNVRGAAPAAGDDMFAAGLPIFSGKGVLVKTYAFALQN